MRTFIPIGCSLINAMLIAGCTNAEGSAGSVEVVDSAGVTIVRSSRPTWGEHDGWRLSEEPVLALGGFDVDPDYEFFQVTGTTILSDGSVAVADNGNHQVRFYDAGGVFLGAAGREGEGPGEFAMLSWLTQLEGDSLLVWDGRLRRASVFSGAGEFARSFSLEDNLFWGLSGWRDGTIIGREVVMMMGEDQVLQDGVRRQSVSYALFGAEGEQVSEIGVFPEPEIWVEVGPDHPHMWSRAFGRLTLVAGGDSLIWVNTGDSTDIDAFDMTGTISRIVSPPRISGEVVASAADMDAWVEAQVSSVNEGMRDHMRPFFEGVQPPDPVPAYDRFMVDPDGNLWAEAYRLPSRSHNRWLVFAPDGAYLGDVIMPSDFLPLEIGSDFVVGKSTDDLEIEYVENYRLIKGS